MQYLDLPTGRPSVTRTARRQATESLRTRLAVEEARSREWVERRRMMRPVSVLAIGDWMAALETERLAAIEAQWRSDLAAGLELQLEAERSLPFYQAQRRGRPRAGAAAPEAGPAPQPDQGAAPASMAASSAAPAATESTAPAATSAPERPHYITRSGKMLW